MKAINADKIIKAYEELESARSRYNFVLKYHNSNAEVSNAKTRLDDAEKAYTKSIEKLSAEITAAEGRATARTISADNIIETLMIIDDRLLIPKKAMESISVSVDFNAQTFPRAYKYRAESTFFDAVYNHGWKITSIYRGYTRGKSNAVLVTLTDESKKAIIDRMTHFEI